MTKQKERMVLEHQGNHHHAKIAVDSKTKIIAAGAIYNFSENAGAMFQVKDGKVGGTIMHTGKTHSFRLEAKQNGQFDAVYRDKRYGGLEVDIKGGVASLRKGKLPEAGVTVNGKHHKLKLKRGAFGKLSGTLESKDTKNGKFKIELKDGKPRGEYVHSGGTHETRIGLSPDGWKAGVALKKGGLKISFDVQNGMVKPTKGVKAGVRLDLGF